MGRRKRKTPRLGESGVKMDNEVLQTLDLRVDLTMFRDPPGGCDHCGALPPFAAEIASASHFDQVEHVKDLDIGRFKEEAHGRLDKLIDDLISDLREAGRFPVVE